VASVTKGRTQKLPERLTIVEVTDMTIHWKVVEEHFLMVVHFPVKNAFSEFFSKNLSP
jgi:hypothetical protein